MIKMMTIKAIGFGGVYGNMRKEYQKHKKRIGFPNLSCLPPNNRIRNLYHEFNVLLSTEFDILAMPAFGARMTEKEREILTKKFMDEIDVFFGYDRQFMRTRYSCANKPKAIIPMFADMTRGGITLWMNKHYFIKSDILMFSSMADKEIYHDVVVESDLQTIVVPLPITSGFEHFQYINTTEECVENIRILYVGRLVREKNIRLVIDLCAQLKRKMNITLTLVGNWFENTDGGEYRREVMELIERLGMSDNITFKGYLQNHELIEAYRDSDIFINLSTNPDENFGMVIIEAMSQGLPIICTDWGGFKDHVIDGWNGFKINTRLCEQEASIDIAEAVGYAEKLCSLKVRAEMSANARKMYENNYQRSIVLEMIRKEILQRGNISQAVLKFSEKATKYCLKYILNGVMKREYKDFFGQEYYVSHSKWRDMNEDSSGRN